MTTTLPAARTQFTDGQGRPTPPFYRFLQNLKRVQDGSASDDEVAQLEQDIKTIALALGSPTGDVSDIPPFSNGNPTLRVNFPLGMEGLLQNGFAILSWMGTTDDVPEGENLYFTDARAQAAAVDNAITASVTNKAPSEHAVAEALADLSPGVPYFIPDGETYKVADDIQALFLEPIELAGDSSLEIDGHLEDANVPDTFGKTYQAGMGIEIANPDSARPTVSSTLGSISVTNDVADYASLPTNLTTADADQYWVTRDTRMAYRWSGTAWPAEGSGVRLGNETSSYYAELPMTKFPSQDLSGRLWTVGGGTVMTDDASAGRLVCTYTPDGYSEATDGRGQWAFLHDQTEPWTVDMWVARVSTTAWCFGTGRGASAETGIGVAVQLEGARLYVARGTTGQFVVENLMTSGGFPTDTFTHLSVEWNGTQYVMYVGGIQSASATPAVSPSTAISDNPMHIGNVTNGGMTSGEVRIAQVQITRGQAVHGGPFTPSTL